MDYSEKSDGIRGASDADSGAESVNMQQKSLVDMDEDVDSDDSEDVSDIQANETACWFLSAVCLQILCSVALYLCLFYKVFMLSNSCEMQLLIHADHWTIFASTCRRLQQLEHHQQLVGCCLPLCEI